MAGIGVHQRTFSGLHRGDGPGFHVPVVAKSIAMSFLKRIFSGGGPGSEQSDRGGCGPIRSTSTRPSVPIISSWRARSRSAWTNSSQRQLRYAAYAWEPPKQGGEKRADDEEHRGPRLTPARSPTRLPPAGGTVRRTSSCRGRATTPG